MLFNKRPIHSKKIKIGVHEAYTIWRSLVDRYIFIDSFHRDKNFTHDKDLLMYTAQMINDLRKETIQLEELCRLYSIQSPQPNTRGRYTVGNSEIAVDRLSAGIVYRFLRLDLNILFLGLKNPSTNEAVKKFLVKLTHKQINRLDKYIPYLKMKNWIQTPPLYPYVTGTGKDILAINEVYMLYQHLLFRYNNIHQTSTLALYATDTDFKVLMELGTRILQKQITRLENKLLYFGIALPNPNPINVPTPENKEVLNDKFIFNLLFSGMQDAMVLHGTAISEVIVNDELRKFFINLTLEELNLIDKMDKYGKLKGWVDPIPSYRGG